MQKIKVSICTGTACFVMGASELLVLAEEMPDNLKDIVEIEGVTCLDKCKNSECGKAPFVLINGELYSGMNRLSLLDKLYEIAGIKN